MKRIWLVGFLLLIATALIAHPHFQKTTTAKLSEDVEVSLTIVTVPANMDHVAQIKTGGFASPGRPKFKASTNITAGSSNIAAGTYTIGVVKNGTDDWTMVLAPGELSFGEVPDMSQVIKLDSEFWTRPKPVEHLVVDVIPGESQFEGKAVILLGFGTMWLQGLIN